MNQSAQLAVVLGSSGLIGSSIAKRLEGMGYGVVGVDRRRRPGRSITSGFVRQNILEPGKLLPLLKNAQPDVVVNAINLATLFSEDPGSGYPQMIRFYAELWGAFQVVNRPVHYIHMGTTGSGGLGFDIPFTHGGKLEDLPIIHKAAFSGISTALLLLMARSHSKPELTVSEIKPGLAIFEDKVTREKYGDAHLVVLDGGESGAYTYEELASLTQYMGFTTVGRIVDQVCRVLQDERETVALVPHDVISCLNANLIQQDSADLELKERYLALLQSKRPDPYIIATGNLGPPSLTRHLIEEGNHSATSRAATYAYLKAEKPTIYEEILHLDQVI